MKKLLIAFLVLLLTLAAAFLLLKDRPASPLSFSHRFKLAGEWLDVNFLTFGAPQKQVKHLEFAQRRVDEFIQVGGEIAEIHTGDDYDKALAAVKFFDRPLAELNDSYKLELARAEFMAEQLSLLDYKFIPAIEAVYTATLDNLGTFQDDSLPAAYRQIFSASAQEYNRQAIKFLLQKHQHTPADTERYKALVESRLTWVEKRKNILSSEQQLTLNKVKIILSQGREIEWAYDLLSGIEL